ncbi:methylaspartate mutase [Streptomyces griseoincarnatus]
MSRKGDLPVIQLEPRVAAGLPSWDEILDHLSRADRPTVADVLKEADRRGRPAVQPRCGVGGHREMVELLRLLEAEAAPDILSVTVDAHTRLRHYATAARTLRTNPGGLNGYPLVTHGWQHGRALAAAVRVPLEVRHGSPDGRDLFAVSLASGILSFEGGGISYNLPYSKNVPLAVSLQAWREVDLVCGLLAEHGVVVDREVFGTLTAVLVPPSISLAVSFLEARMAADAGVVCLSIAYPQSGEIHQDVAALRSIRALARRYLPAGVRVHPVLHQFMGVFPQTRAGAEQLILFGGLVGRLGGATKIVNKTSQEALGIPVASANAAGIALTRLACTELLDDLRLDEARVAEEEYWVQREVAEIIEPLLDESDLLKAVDLAFQQGRLDIPFPASTHAHAAILPKRDADGAIRYLDPGNLPLTDVTVRRSQQCLRRTVRTRNTGLVDMVTADINYFLRLDRPAVTPFGGSS